ncbi:MAG: TolC family protein [Gemmatimonadales bacterium]|nr:TolC family protein [Gemmatimonadales bacterium]
MHTTTVLIVGATAPAKATSVLRALALALVTILPPVGLLAQGAPEPPGQSAVNESHPVDSLVSWALAVSPHLRAARERLRAAQARVPRAGARPDPMLMAGIQNFPVSQPSFSDFMTMKMIGIGQTLPYPGKLPLLTQAAVRGVAAGEAELADARLAVEAAVKSAYYDLAYLDRALEIVERNRDLLLDVMKVTEARYGVGTGGQEEALRVRVEAARLGEEAVALLEQRRARLARLNAELDRPSETPVTGPIIPRRVTRAAIADSAAGIRFVSTTLGARAADSPLPPLAVLQDAVVRQNPMLRAHEARIAEQRSRAELARKAHLPDLNLSLSYGQRTGFRDMLSAQVSIPIPLQRGRKQDQLVVEADAELAALEAEHHEQANMLQAEVARLHAELERDRAQLGLYVKAILPQGRAALTSATAGYQVGRTDFLALLDAQSTLFDYETTYFRVLSDFAKTLAELERLVGEEVVQ